MTEVNGIAGCLDDAYLTNLQYLTKMFRYKIAEQLKPVMACTTETMHRKQSVIGDDENENTGTYFNKNTAG